MRMFTKFKGLLLLTAVAISFSEFLFGQSIVNGSVNGTTVGNSMINPTNVPGWSNCGGSPDLCSNAFPSYTNTSNVASCASPNGDPRLGLASISAGECAQTTITGLTTGQTYYLCFYGACFGTTTGLFNGTPVQPVVCVGATCTTLSIPKVACVWNLYSLTFIATNPTMTLSASYQSTSNFGYASLDGFYLGTNPTCLIPLASRFSDFEAEKQENYSTNLSWKALVSEVGDYFEIERLTEMDSVWQHIGSVATNSLDHTDFSWVDEEPVFGRNYYRVVGYNSNQELTESTDIRLVEFNQIKEGSIHIYPNPAKNELTVLVNDLTKNELEIYSSEGKKVYTHKLVDVHETLDISSLKQGVYFIRVGQDIEKFVKE